MLFGRDKCYSVLLKIKFSLNIIRRQHGGNLFPVTDYVLNEGGTSDNYKQDKLLSNKKLISSINEVPQLIIL